MLESLPFYDRQLVHVERRAPRAAQYRSINELALPPQVAIALAKRGITQLYTHQFDAIDALRRGENVVLSTATASGKSLAYNVPMLASLLEAPDSTFLYMFPTKVRSTLWLVRVVASSAAVSDAVLSIVLCRL